MTTQDRYRRYLPSAVTKNRRNAWRTVTMLGSYPKSSGTWVAAAPWWLWPVCGPWPPSAALHCHLHTQPTRHMGCGVGWRRQTVEDGTRRTQGCCPRQEHTRRAGAYRPANNTGHTTPPPPPPQPHTHTHNVPCPQILHRHSGGGVVLISKHTATGHGLVVIVIGEHPTLPSHGSTTGRDPGGASPYPARLSCLGIGPEPPHTVPLAVTG
jgi:hypothetical protein